MVDVIEIRKQIEQAKIDVAEQREIVKQRRKEAEQQEKKVREQFLEQEKKFPKPTQQLLRSGMFAGLEGRKRRQQIERAKKELKLEKQGRKKEISLFKEGLIKYEKEELEPFVKEIEQKEKQIKAIEQWDKEIRRIQNLYQKYKGEDKGDELGYELATLQEGRTYLKQGASLSNVNDWVSQKLRYRELKDRAIAEQLAEYQKSFEESKQKQKEFSSSPSLFGVNPIYDSSGKLIGIEDNIKKISRLPTTTEQFIYGSRGKVVLPSKSSIRAPVFNKRSSSFNIGDIRDLSRTELIKNINPLRSISMPVSKISSLFRTTGSPVRMTKLTSPKSRGYIPSHKVPVIKQQVKKPIFILKSKPQIKKIKKKSFIDFGEDNFFPKKKTKKKSIWGI